MRLALPLLLLPLATLPLRATDSGEALRFFENRIRPLLVENCQKCHGPDKAKGGLRLHRADTFRKGGDSGVVVVPGEPEASPLVKAVRRTDPDFSMPPKKALSPDQVKLLESWVKMGAPWPADATPAPKLATDEHGFSDEDRSWWAIQPVVEPKVPASGEGWTISPIDRFVAERLEGAGLKPAPEADPLELVRRLYFDLHGLPPSPEQVSAFLNDKRPDAWPRLVRELLDSPRYGERWAQHWLDVVRYAESDGYREDAFRPDAYRYRDYVIRSFNQDKPYNQLVREHLAGDEIAPNDPDSFIGTAYLRHGVYEWNQRNARMHWDLIVNEMTRVTGEAFLGLGIGCAQCHDHKFDPILQKDYFALQAFLSSTAWPMEAPLATPEQVAEYKQQLAEWEDATREIRDEMQSIVKGGLEGKANSIVKQFPEDIQVIYRKPAAERTPYEDQLAYLVERQVDRARSSYDEKKALKSKPDTLKRYEELTAKLKAFEGLKPKPLPEAFVARDVSATPTPAILHTRNGKKVIDPAFLTLLGEPKPEIQPTESSTGRRTALANWIARDDNPLSTRVIVNRIWQHHFGQGIVPTPNDFGRLGETPSHPELLDWLTRRFLEGGWRIKPLHELILNSATYRQTARREPATAESTVDPGNRLLWRFPPQRLDAEQVRDAMLAVSGELKQRPGGPSVDGDDPYRSIFVKRKRNTPDALFSGFDAPAGFDSAPQRVATTTPIQSLLLVNGEWVLDRAEQFARRLLKNGSQINEATIREAYLQAFNRKPSTAETEAALAFIRDQISTVTGPVAPEPKYPDENGLRPISQRFKPVKGLGLRDQALWLQPGSRFERLEVTKDQLKGDEFTIEAVTYLERLYKDASVNTLVSRWNGSTSTTGWSLGVTSEKSRYEPRNFVLQLIGEDFQSNPVYDVVASDLRFPLNTPVYIAASIRAATAGENRTSGSVTFFMKDLSDPKAPLETRMVDTDVVGRVQNPDLKTLVGGRDAKGHLWDGQIARLVISKGALQSDQLIVARKARPADRILDWTFTGKNGEQPAAGTAWVRPTPKSPATGQPPKMFGALTDFCQALLDSNEFLYLH